MSRQWTENQSLAIDSRRGSILVSAAAGSGKTAALVERVIKMVTDSENPVAIDRILIVTYTNAAAAELKERVSKKLGELILKEPDNRWYRRQLVYLPYASISTVDSFCGSIVREFASHLAISDDYRIADSGELAILRQDALRMTLDELYQQADCKFFDLIETFSTSRDDSAIAKYIFKFHEFLCSHPFSDEWLAEKYSYYANCEDIASGVWGRVMLDYARSAVDYCIELTESSLRALEEEPELMSAVFELFDSDSKYLSNLKSALENISWDEISLAASSFVTGALRAKKFTNHPIKLKVAANRDIVKKTVKVIQNVFSLTEAECIDDIKALTPIALKMFETVTLFDENFKKLKREKNVADFSDVAHWALNILVSRNDRGEAVPSELARVISDRFDQVMVDEYQDANEVQDMIYNAVSHNGTNLFVVGDVKQSIYGFRQAMPEIFLSRKNSLPLYFRDKDNYPAKVILEKNFRSRKEVTDYVNFTFSLLMSVETGDLDYNEEERLVAAASYDDTDSPSVELHLIDATDSEETDVSLIEARQIAKTVLSLCKDTYIKDGDKKRLVRFGDVAIIMRNKSRYAQVYADELKRCGVPVVCDEKLGFLTSQEIALAVNFLRIIDNPLQDIPLTAVMLSPLFGFTPDELAEIRLAERKSALYVALLKYADEGSKKAQRFIDALRYLRALAVTEPSDVFIGELYEYTHFVEISAAAFGKASMSNLKLLVSYAEKYEQGGSRGVSAFVSFLDRLEAEKTDLPAAVSTGEAHFNCVRIMSVHSSKGLEFPVCIIANTHRKFISDKSENVLLHSKLGFASKRRDIQLSTSYTTMPRNAISLEISRSEMSEELRVLYVAMTRAKEKLIMFVTTKNMQSYVSKRGAAIAGGDSISPFVVRDCTYLSDWLVMCALMHPGADNLRSYASLDEPSSFICEDTGNFSVKILDAESSFAELPSQAPITSTILFEDVPEGVDSIIRDRFDFAYPDVELCAIPQKVTASQLAHKENEKTFEHIFKSPSFMSDLPMSGAEKGTAFHLFLEHCSFENARLALSDEISRLENSNVLTAAQVQVIDKNKVKKFIDSEIITLALSAKEYFREYKFTVNIPASMVDSQLSDAYAQTPVVLQGAIDLLIIDSDGIIVVDYKTDRIRNTEELVSMYSKQLLLYKVAVEQIFSKPVKKCLFYSVCLSEIKEVK